MISRELHGNPLLHELNCLKALCPAGQFMAKPIHEALLQILLFGASALCALGATHYVCQRQTAEEQSAAFALISELLDANALDYHAAGNSLRAVWLAFSITRVTAPTGFPS